MDEMRRNAAWSFLVEDQRFALDARKAADSRADRAAGAELHRVAHLAQAGILDRLAGGIDSVDDELVDLALDLVVDTLGGIEALFVVSRFNLARDAAFLVAGVEARDWPSAAFAGDDIAPRRLDVATERRHEPQTSHHHTPHRLTP
jgi:hypothetical protein